jgi:hypothetical protein
MDTINRKNENILFFLDDKMKDVIYHFSKLYKEIRGKMGNVGKLFWTSNFDDINFHSDETMSFDGEIISAVILNLPEGYSPPKDKVMQLIQSHLNGKIIFPDSPVYGLLGSKHLLALITDAKDNICLTDEEVNIINRHIPWTAKLDRKEVCWHNIQVELHDFIKGNKDSLVIKKAKSIQGRDVFVGKFIPQDEWKVIAEKYIGSSEWLVQEYCEPDIMTMCDQSGWIGSYSSVWGIFDVGSSYSGSFIRSNRLNSGNGVINSANGATEFVVLEEKNHKGIIAI